VNLSASFSQGGYLGAGYCGSLAIPSSNTADKEIIFGGAQRLHREIETTLEVMDGDLFVVASACQTDIIGDDVRSVLSGFPGRPIMHVEAGGFRGDSHEGYARFVENLFLQYIPKAQPKKNHVNLLGLVPGFDPFFRGDLEELRRLLGLLGVRATTFFDGQDSLADVRAAGGASLNIIFSPALGDRLGRALRESHGTGYLAADLPIGARAAAAFLNKVAERLNVSPKKAKAAAEGELERYYRYVERLADLWVDADFQNHAIVVSGATSAKPLAAFLDSEAGWLVDQVYITDQAPEEARAALEENFFQGHWTWRPRLDFETGTQNIQSRFHEAMAPRSSDGYQDGLDPLFVLGSTADAGLAQSLGATLLAVSFPIVNRAVLARGYAGFSGGLRLFEDLADAQVAKRV
jgi:nitrogenase molybdenum-iron protein beta chain